MFNKPASTNTTQSVTPPTVTVEPSQTASQPATPPQQQSSKKLLFIVSAVVLLLSLAFGAFALMQQPAPTQPSKQPAPVTTPTPTPEPTEEATFCTMDAKICPDGSSVGRVPPSCEFAACPGDETEGSTESAMPTIDIDSTITSTESAEN